MINAVILVLRNNYMVILLAFAFIFLIYFRFGVSRFLHLVAAITGLTLGKRASWTFKIFFFVKPPMIEIEDPDAFRKQSPYPIEVYTYAKVANKLDTGDIVLFCGSTKSSTNVLSKWANMTPLSHIGIVVKIYDELYLFEATLKRGAQIAPLRDRIQNYPAKIVLVRKLITDRTAEMQENLEKFISEALGTKHDFTTLRGNIEMFKAATDIKYPLTQKEIFKNRKSIDGLFCSETVAESFIQMGLLPDDANISEDYPASNEYTPGDFTRFGFNHNRESYLVNNLLQHAKLEDEFMIAKSDWQELVE